MKCPECNGAGEIKYPAGYRDNDVPQPDKDDFGPKENLISRIKFKLIYLKEFLAQEDWMPLKFFSGIAIGIFILILIACAFSQCANEISSERNRLREIEDKKGFVVVQYNNDMKVSRCYVVHTLNAMTINGSSASIIVPDMNDIDGFARKLGVEDPNSCIR